MYLNLMTDDQKAVFLGMALKMVRADGRVVEEEYSMMSALQNELGWDIQPVAWTLDDKEALAVFDSKRARMVVLLELYLLAVCDGALPPEEIEIFRSISKAFGFSGDDCRDVLMWARAMAPLAVQGWRMALSGEAGQEIGPDLVHPGLDMLVEGGS